MEVLDSAILKSSTSFYTRVAKFSETPKISCFSGSQVCFRKGNQVPSLRKSSLKAGASGFDDKGHVEYYSRFSPVCGEKKGKGKKGSNGIPTKKRAKLLKGLVEDLSTLTDLGFGMELGCDDNLGFVADEKSAVISQAAETLLTQLKQLRAEEEEQMKCKSKDCESSSSSSSSSESSDNECDDEVIDMKSVKNKTVVQPITATNEIHPVNEVPLSTTPSTLEEKYPIQQSSHTSEQKCSNMILDMALKMAAESDVLNTKALSLHQSKAEEKKIEVCMGGKCKKLGAPALMKEFERVIGDEGVVEGCKCMGKCKSAPNVRAVSCNLGDDSLKIPTKSVCTSVGLGDVEAIVANYFGGESSKGQLCVAAVAY